MAVSAVIERRALRMSVMRPDGTPRSSASRLALSLRAASSRFSRRPGCATGAIVLSSVIVDDFDIVGVPLAKLEANPPTVVYAHGPLSLPIAFQLVQPDALEGAQVLQRLGDVQSRQQIDCRIKIQPAELI